MYQKIAFCQKNRIQSETTHNKFWDLYLLCPLHHGALGAAGSAVSLPTTTRRKFVVYFEILSRNLPEDLKKTVEKNTRQAVLGVNLSCLDTVQRHRLHKDIRTLFIQNLNLWKAINKPHNHEQQKCNAIP